MQEPRRTQLLERALTAAERIEDHGAKALVFASLAEQMQEPDRTALLERALAAVEDLWSKRAEARGLESLAQRLPEPRRTELLKRNRYERPTFPMCM
jgi:hypothetical protein